LVPNEITYNSVINACAKGDESQSALDLLDEMRSRGLVPNEITYNSVIDACAKCGESQRALGLLDEMRSRGLVPNEITYSSVIDACAKGGESRRALDLFDEMLSYDLTPHSIAYDAALNACVIGHQPERALSLFESLQRGRLTPELSHWSHLLDAIGPNHAKSRSLLLQMLEQPFFAGAESFEAGVPRFDLHGLSAGAAEMVVRWWLLQELPQRMSAGKMSAPTQVALVTGHGESRVLRNGSVVKQRVVEVANELGTVVEQSNRGRVVLAWPLTGDGNASATV
jgi:pentatricopeptide repeat protein